MPPETLDRLVEFFKALADSSRLSIVGLLAQQPRSVDELATILDLKAPTVSHHLKRLKALSLVTMQREGNIHLYSLNEEALHCLNREVFKAETIARIEVNLPVTHYERKVLDTFLIGGRLTAIPAQRKKRDVILRHLVCEFEHDTLYSESDVNEILRVFHPDVATLRRELVGARLMVRKEGIYRRCHQDCQLVE